MAIKRVYYAGNPYIEKDALALDVARTLMKSFPELEFEHITNTFQLIDKELEESIILDVADTINKVTLLNSKDIKPGGNFSAHDFDLGALFEILGKDAKLIAIPLGYKKEEAAKETHKLLDELTKNI